MSFAFDAYLNEVFKSVGINFYFLSMGVILNYESLLNAFYFLDA